MSDAAEVLGWPFNDLGSEDFGDHPYNPDGAPTSALAQGIENSWIEGGDDADSE